MTRNIALLGAGAIGISILEAWRAAPLEGYHLATILARPSRRQAVLETLPAITLTETLETLLQTRPSLIIEAAGQPAIAAHAETILRTGTDLLILSAGALADDALRATLTEAAKTSGARILIPAGALAGLDGLRSLTLLPGAAARYTSTKSPRAWLGTPAEQKFDLATLTAATELFRGTAREAARAYPKNANLAATVALSGIGFDATEVRLIADPAASENIASLEVTSPHSTLTVEIRNRVFPSNPKSSVITGHSALAALRNTAAAISFA